MVDVVHNHAHRTVFTVQAHVNHGLLEQRIADMGRGHEQFALEAMGCVGNREIRCGCCFVHTSKTKGQKIPVKAQNCPKPFHKASQLWMVPTHASIRWT